MIYENSRKPLQITRTIPSNGWFQELERLEHQFHYEVNALSGMKFFYLTRSALFALAGIILTYEIAMMKYETTEAEQEIYYCDN